MTRPRTLIDPSAYWNVGEGTISLTPTQAARLWDILASRDASGFQAAVELQQDWYVFPYLSEAAGELGRLEVIHDFLKRWGESFGEYIKLRESQIKEQSVKHAALKKQHEKQSAEDAEQ